MYNTLCEKFTELAIRVNLENVCNPILQINKTNRLKMLFYPNLLCQLP